MKVVCEICGKDFARIGNHISKHNISIDEYKAIYPGKPVCAYTHSEQTLAKMRGPRPAFQGHKKSDETKRKLSEARKGKTFRPHSEETLQKMREAWIRRKADRAKYAEYTKAVSDRMKAPEMASILQERFTRLAAENSTNGKSSDTSLERKMASFLRKSGIEYDQQFILKTSRGDFAFDFRINDNRLIETDGEYWHTKSLEQINRDKLKTSLAEEQGFVVVRISDKDWRPELVLASDSEVQAHGIDTITRRQANFQANAAEQKAEPRL